MDLTTQSLVNYSINNTFTDIMPRVPEVPVSQEVEDTVSVFFEGLLIFFGSIFGLVMVYHCALSLKSSCVCFEDEDFKMEDKNLQTKTPTKD